MIKDSEMKVTVSSHKRVEEKYIQEGCYITEIWSTDIDHQVSIARVHVEPGKVTQTHSLRGTLERYLIIEGKGAVEIEGLGGWKEVKRGDVVLIPESKKQQIKNTGDVDLVFYCICSPRFVEASYEKRED